MKTYEETNKEISDLSERPNFNIKESYSGVKSYVDYTIIRVLQYVYDIKSNANKKIFIINIISFIFYKISLIGCEKGEENACVTDFIVEFVLEGVIVILNGLLISINICLIYSRIIKSYHLLYIFLYYLIVCSLTFDFTLLNHGGYNCFFLIFFIFLFLFLEILIYILYLLFKKSKIYFFITTSIIILIPFLIDLILTKKYDCKDFLMGLNGTKLINLEDAGCNFTKPSNCRMEFYYPFLNFSKIIKFDFGSKNNFLMDKRNKEELKKSNKFGIPIISHFGSEVNFFDKDFLMSYVQNNTIDMEKEYIFNDTFLKPEIEIWFDEKKKGTVHINVTKNETLIKERKKLENKNSLFENVIILYIDAVSRNRFKSALPKTAKFIEQFMKNNNEDAEKRKYKSFQFLKYHTVGVFTQSCVQPMMYGNTMYSGSGIQITKYLKQNGYITAMAFDQCVFEVFFDREQLYTYNVTSDYYDHSNNQFFCDQNYFGILFRGVNSFFRRYLYGKETFEYNFEYSKQFWNNYKDSRKYLMLASMYAHESTSNVLGYMDNSLYEFFNYMYENKLLKNTAIFYISDHGLHTSAFYAILAGENYFHERSIPFLFILYEDNDKVPKEEMYNNQFKFVTGYDIYETLYHIIFGNDYVKQDICSDKRNSLFKYIYVNNRDCDFYREITPSNCFCKKNKKK